VTPPVSPAARRPLLPAGFHDIEKVGRGMEGHQARQYGHSHFQSVSQMVSAPHTNGESSVVYSQRRHHPGASPTSQPDIDAGDQSQTTSYGFSQSSQFNPQMQDQALQYQNDFGSENTRQPFQPYSQNMLYNLVSQGQSTEYEPVTHFNPRQNTAIEVLSNQFNVPPYFSSSDSTTRGPQVSQTYTTTNYTQAGRYSQRSTDVNTTTSPPFLAGISDYSQPSRSANAQSMDRSQSQRSADQPFSNFYSSLRQAFRSIHHGDLLQAGHQLLQLSEWVSGHAIELGESGALNQSLI
jgi:hypothetical protein